jgi:hypothetical protein
MAASKKRKPISFWTPTDWRMAELGLYVLQGKGKGDGVPQGDLIAIKR